ncbi:MAG: hypothetical protein SLAVMIC_00831 [uncultured marine phage]|uniref:Uncharacterized protein n=1 Tax=uncultured marine phage TaxID=707152 RepID=A0A8D9CFT6_9VIRU|nr:MAG: hypothetical protein SLAVMIC_00831 [uncultured marine phage]
MKLKKYIEFVNENKSNVSIKFLEEITPFSKERRPQTDDDISHEKDFVIKAVQKFDEIFGTDYYQKFGSDFHVLVGSDIYFSKEIVEALSDEAVKPNVYMKFDLLKNKDESVESLFDHLMRMTLTSHEGHEDDGSLVDFLCNKIPNRLPKEELYYKLFRKIGSEFDAEIIKEVMETKTHYDLGGDNKQMPKSIQKAFLSSLTQGMKRYHNKVQKGKFNLIDCKEYFKIVAENYLNSDQVNKLTIREDYINKRLKDWYEYLRMV